MIELFPQRSATVAAALFGLTAVALSAADARAQGNVPENIPGGIEPEATLRFFLKEEPWSGLLELQGSSQTDSRQYRSASLGGYYRLFSHLRAGLFYQRQYGFRHDEDWQKDPATGAWGWLNTNARGEDLIFADISPKFVVSFLPGDAWTFELKTRWYYNFFDHQEVLRIRPNLSYFWLRQGEPLMTFFAQVELAAPFNLGETPFNERWLYLGALYHACRGVQAGLYGALKWEAWRNTADYTALTGNTYEVSATSTVLGLLAIFTIPESR